MDSLTQVQLEKFLSKIDLNSPNKYNGESCWEWKAGKEGDGYGAFLVGKKQYKTHRLAWMISRGDIPRGMHVLHKCDNRACCNPKHLYLGTQRDNMRDKILRGRRGDTRPKHPAKGSANKSTKLSDDQKSEIRARYNPKSSSGESSYKLAKEFGVSQATIHRIATET